MRLGWTGLLGLYVAIGMAGCAPRAAHKQADAEVAPPPAPLETALEIERERSSGLETALEESTKEIQRLSRELAKVREREEATRTRLKEVLRSRAMRADGAEGETGGAAEQVAELKKALAREQALRTDLEARLADLQAERSRAAAPAAGPDVAALQQKLASEEKHRLELETQLGELRDEVQKARTEGGPQVAELKELLQQEQRRRVELKKQLAAEQRRRTELEQQLERLRVETSAPPFEGGSNPTEVARLRDELQAERAERTRLLGEFRDLQRRAANGNGKDSAEARALRARLIELESRQQEVLVSVARTLAADRRREQDLKRNLNEVQSALQGMKLQPAVAVVPPEVTPEVGVITAENARLQHLLEEERQRNARLAAKLKLAGRVTDLIFRMREQESGEQQGAFPAPAQNGSETTATDGTSEP